MRKMIVLVTVLLSTLILAVPAFATQPTYGAGTWDNFSVDAENLYYDLHGPFEGAVTQPNKPGRAQKGTFVGTVDGTAGECLMNVIIFGKKGVGGATILQCTGELQGLQGTITSSLDDPINFTGSYETWYHFEP